MNDYTDKLVTITCPACGYSSTYDNGIECASIADAIDAFDVIGMDDGVICCPQCAAHISPDEEAVERIQQEMLF